METTQTFCDSLNITLLSYFRSFFLLTNSWPDNSLTYVDNLLILKILSSVLLNFLICAFELTRLCFRTFSSVLLILLICALKLSHLCFRTCTSVLSNLLIYAFVYFGKLVLHFCDTEKPLHYKLLYYVRIQCFQGCSNTNVHSSFPLLSRHHQIHV